MSEHFGVNSNGVFFGRVFVNRKIIAIKEIEEHFKITCRKTNFSVFFRFLLFLKQTTIQKRYTNGFSVFQYKFIVFSIRCVECIKENRTKILFVKIVLIGFVFKKQIAKESKTSVFVFGITCTQPIFFL